MEIKLSLTEELRPFKHSHFRQLLHDRVWTHPHIVFKHCIQLVNILKLCLWSFDKDESNIARIIIF